MTFFYKLPVCSFSDCPVTLDLKPLSSDISCYISDICTSIQCCLQLDIVQTAVEFQLAIDSCEKKLKVAIEKISIVKDLHNYTFGKTFVFLCVRRFTSGFGSIYTNMTLLMNLVVTQGKTTILCFSFLSNMVAHSS